MNNCPTFEDLNALIDGDLAAECELSVRRHLDFCSACARTADALTALKQTVGRAYDNEAPPPALARALAAKYRKRRIGWHWWSAALAAVMLGAVTIGVLEGDHGSALSMLAAALVAEHVNSLSEPAVLEAAIDDPQGLSGWFQDRLSYPVAVKTLPDWRLLGGRQRTIFGHPLAVALYEKDGARISLFMTNASGAAANQPIHRSFEAVSRRRCRNVEPYRICLHREGEMLIGIVAPRYSHPERLLPVAATF